MSMEHQAFVFNYDSFQQELAPVLYAALQTGSIDALIAFIHAHRAALRRPDEGDPLLDDWESIARAEGVDRAGEVALTKYYDPLRDIGLNYDWQELSHLFPDPAMLLGVPFGPPNHLFDPAKMGAWLQSPIMAQKHLAVVQELSARNPALDLAKCQRMFETPAQSQMGLYVKF
jgi:hypothetical protein